MTLQDTVRYFTEETKILPCLSVTCGGAGLCVQARGGVINEQGTPVSDRTLFDLASLTKLFTGLLTMRLWEVRRAGFNPPGDGLRAAVSLSVGHAGGKGAGV